MASATATVTAVAGSGERGFADGPAAVVRFAGPCDIAVAPDGGYVVADTFSNRVRRVAPDGAVTTVAGTGEEGCADGPGGGATFSHPAGVAVDRRGDIFATESDRQGRVRKITRGDGNRWVVSTVVAAGLSFPAGIAVDPAGQLVVADFSHHRVVRVDPTSGGVTVIAGDGIAGFVDGPGATARFVFPTRVAVDRGGDIFVAERGGVRRISGSDGAVSTVAGTVTSGRADGTALSELMFSRTVAVDGRGALLVSDRKDGVTRDEFRLRRVAASADRAVATVACGKTQGAPSERINGSAIDRDGSVLVAVASADRIFRVTGLGLAPPSAPAWSLRAHRRLAAAVAAVGVFVATVMLCASRLDADTDTAPACAVPRLPVEMWLAVLSMLRPDQMVPRR